MHMYIHYVYKVPSWDAHTGYHKMGVPGVPLVGCVLRPGRAINCEVLFGKEERG